MKLILPVMISIVMTISCTWTSEEEVVCSKGRTVEVHQTECCDCNPKYIVTPPIGYSFAPEIPPYMTAATDGN